MLRAIRFAKTDQAIGRGGSQVVGAGYCRPTSEMRRSTTWGGAQREIGVKVAGRGSLVLLAGPDVEPELTAVRQFIGPA